MLAKNDLERLSEMRIQDAVHLLQSGRSSAAYYLAGYSVELAIKVCISKLIQTNTIPDKAFINAIYTHRLENLLSTAGLLPQFKADCKTDPTFATNWAIACNWNEESRYKFWDPTSAATLVAAIAEPNHGVLQWVKKHW